MVQKCEDGSSKFACTTCGKGFATKQAAKRHVEIHLDMTHPCIVCGRVFKTRNSLGNHYTQQHRHEVNSPWTMEN